MEQINFASLKRKRDLHIILPVFLVSIIACIDRVNIAYAALTMTEDLPWLTPEIFGAGAGIFFMGYLLLEIPGSLIAAKYSASNGLPVSCSHGVSFAFSWLSCLLKLNFISIVSYLVHLKQVFILLFILYYSLVGSHQKKELVLLP